MTLSDHKIVSATLCFTFYPMTYISAMVSCNEKIKFYVQEINNGKRIAQIIKCEGGSLFLTAYYILEFLFLIM